MVKSFLKSVLPEPLWKTAKAANTIRAQLPDPVLVYQMGKVGSSTVSASLRHAGISNVHVHFIGDHWPQAAQYHRERGDELPQNLYRGWLLRYWLRVKRRQVKVITLVRDPVARKISSAFQLRRYNPNLSVDDASAAKRWLRENIDFDESLPYESVWFDREINAVFDIDVYDHPFDPEKGYTRIQTSRADVLVLRLEDLDDLIPSVVSDFVGSQLAVERTNTRSNDTYRTIKQTFTLPPSTLERIYSQRMVRHFYSDREIDAFIDSWSESASSMQARP
jgi:hypothetical protein